MKRKFALCMIALLIVPVLAWAAAVLEVGSSGSDVTRVQKKPMAETAKRPGTRCAGSSAKTA